MHKRLWAAWKQVAKRIARFNSLVLCLVLYYVILPLVAVPHRLFKDPLRLKGGASFIERNEGGASLEEASRQG